MTTDSIRVITAPRVYVISRPSLDCRELMQFLTDTGFPTWETDDVPDSQILTEVCARICYRSFAAGRPHKAHIAHLRESGHLSTFEHAQWTLLITGVSRTLTHELVRHRHLNYCLSGDTEVYLDRPRRGVGVTRGGFGKSQTRTLRQLWEMWQDRRRAYVKTMTIRTVADSGVVVHNHVRRVMQSGVKPVFRLTTACGYSVKASADHLFWRPDGTFTRLGDLSPGDAVIANGVHLLHDAEWVRAQVAAGRTTPEIAAAVGAAACTVRKWRRIHGCAADYGSGTVGVSPWNKGVSVYLRKTRVSAAEREALAARMTGDSNPAWKGGHETWANGRAAANDIYRTEEPAACEFCGMAGLKLEIHHVDGNPKNNARDNIAFHCTLCHKARHTGTPPLKTFPTLVSSVEPAGEEMTYDLEMEAPYHRFVANGLVVHNSQESQRFVDASDVAFVLPPELADDWARKTRSALDWLRACEIARDAYCDLCVSIAEKHGGKLPVKEVRQAARSVLPGCAETRIAVSGNARAWREMLARRLSAGADLEFQRLARLILSRLTSEAPDLFEDVR